MPTMDWEGKFSSIIKETETNLARVKGLLVDSASRPEWKQRFSDTEVEHQLSQSFSLLAARPKAGSAKRTRLQRLGSARSTTKTALALSSTTPETLDGAFGGNLSCPTNPSMYMPSAGAPWTGLSASLLAPLAKSNSYPNMASSMSSAAPMAMSDPAPGAFRQSFSNPVPYPPPDCYAGCDNSSLSMLHDKINMQSKGIENLTNIVRRLEEERNFYYRMVRDLREELTLLNRNVSEGRGDARSDHKVEQWKREMTREIHSLQQQVNSQRSRDGDDNSAGSQVAALSRDLHELKMHLHNECDSMKRTIDGVKSRLGKVEVDVTALRSGNIDLNLKQQMMEEESDKDDISRQQSLVKMMNCHKTVTTEASRMAKYGNDNKLDITELKSSLRTVRAKLGHIEARMYVGLGSSRKVHNVADLDDLLSPDTSDLELDLSSSDGGGLNSHDFTMTGDDIKLKPDGDTFLESADLDLSTDLTSGDALDINDLI